MRLFGKVTVLLLGVYVFGLTRSTKEFDRLKLRVKHLETRLNTEFTFRDEDIAEITIRLDDIDKVLNATIGKRPLVPLITTNASMIDFETVDTLEEDFTRLRTAFTEEKYEAVRFRREIPKIEKNLISLNEDVESYCKVSLNNSDKLLTSFETVTKAAEEISEQVQLNIENEQKMSKQIENIEALVTNLYSRIGYLFRGPSCRSLRDIGILQNGIYKLGQGIQVYCDQITDGGGWIVFQKRLNGETDFYRNWAQYKEGFGDLDGEFWLGNDHLSLLTSDGGHEFRIEIEDFKGKSAYAKYSKFKIYPEEDNYKLEVSGYSGTAGDSLEYHNGMMFSTYDRDHDPSSLNCANRYHGAWWYKNCHNSNLNGHYSKDDTPYFTGIFWLHYTYLKRVEMKFR